MVNKIGLLLIILICLFMGQWGCVSVDGGRLYLQVVTFPPVMLTWGIAQIPENLPIQYQPVRIEAIESGD